MQVIIHIPTRVGERAWLHAFPLKGERGCSPKVHSTDKVKITQYEWRMYMYMYMHKHAPNPQIQFSYFVHSLNHPPLFIYPGRNTVLCYTLIRRACALKLYIHVYILLIGHFLWAKSIYCSCMARPCRCIHVHVYVYHHG